MSILNNAIKRTLTASSGSASETFTTQGICYQIIVKPETASTQYDIQLIDFNSLVVYKRASEVGTLNDLTSLPLSGTYTVSIDNSTVDEDFIILVMVRNS